MPNDLTSIANDLLMAAFDTSLPEDARRAAFEAHEEIKKDAFAAAMTNFRQGTKNFIALSGRLSAAIDGLSPTGAAPLKRIQEQIGRLHARVHDDEGMRTTWGSKEEFEETFKDEAELPPVEESVPIPPAPVGLTRLTAPKPSNSRNFADLEDEYVRFFAGQDWKSAAARREVLDYAERALKNRARYDAVGQKLGVPWWFIAGTHLLESSFNFTTHLHNGDSLQDRTFRVPAGRPVQGSPPFTWEDSAADALKGEKLAGLADWSLARALYRWEAYNGFGYRSRGVPTPYLWSLSTIYEKGKFVGDGVFSATAVSKQCGAAAFLRGLMEMGAAGVAPAVEVRTEGKGDDAESAKADAVAVVDGGLPNIDGAVSTNHDFKKFFEENLPEIQHFEWHEFLVKGGSHQTNHLNTDPPRELWPNVVPLVRVLEEVRKTIGHPVVLTSVYRSKAYNDSLPGAAKSSQHMQFRAADLKAPGQGTPADWHAVVKRLRDAGLFSGGIGKYKTFVHVDTRGVNRDW